MSDDAVGLPPDSLGSSEPATASAEPAGDKGSGLHRLLALQDEDVLADQLAHRRRHLPEQAVLAAVEARLAALRVQQHELDVERSELAGNEADLERETAEVVARITAIEARSRSGDAASYRDQEAMATEIASLSRRRSELEEHEIEVLEQSEPLDAELARLAGERASLEAERAAAEAGVAAAADVVEAGLVASRSRRRVLAAAVPAELRDEYERLRPRLDGVGVARLVRGACSGCHLALPATEIDRLRRAPEGAVAHCDQCGRILVP